MVKWRSLLPQGPQSSTPRNGSLSARSSASASTRSPCCTPASQQEDMIRNGQYRYLDILHLTTDAVVPREEQAAGHEDEEDDEDGDTDRPQQVLVTRGLVQVTHVITSHNHSPCCRQRSSWQVSPHTCSQMQAGRQQTSWRILQHSQLLKLNFTISKASLHCTSKFKIDV